VHSFSFLSEKLSALTAGSGAIPIESISHSLVVLAGIFSQDWLENHINAWHSLLDTKIALSISREGVSRALTCASESIL
jgi:hypothetical protein